MRTKEIIMVTTLGAEAFNEEDRAYRGSRYSEVRDALFANPYQQVWGDSEKSVFPVYKVTLRALLRGMLRARRSSFFREATERAVDSKADLRWGADRKGFRRLLHPNGICMTGVWSITEPTEYSGYFRRGSEALIICRYSTCCSETRRGHSRSLSMVGKLFPTTNPNHADPLRTASFITQQDIGGDFTDYINDAELRNAPNTTLWRRGLGAATLLVTGAVFNRVDKKPSIRQLYDIAELGKSQKEPTRAPTFMRLLVESDQPRIDGDNLDFRDEIMAHIYDRGDGSRKRTLRFRIEVTDEGETHGLPIFERRTFRNWRPIGTIVLDNAVASYNGDFVIHFHHPTWRDDQNDPSTATRMDRRKVR
jgi:hypothetical protein